jgi:Mg2+-importing ATPase
MRSDFSRRMMSVAVETPDKNYRLLTKGAPESVFPRCGFFELGGRDTPDGADHNRRSQELSMDVFRVLAVAYKSLQARPTYSKEEESELILKGYVAFLDPPKETAEKAIAALKKRPGKRSASVRWRHRYHHFLLKHWMCGRGFCCRDNFGQRYE